MPPTESARKGRAIGEENIQPLKTWDELEKMQQIAAKRLVHMSDANGNANASGSTSTSKHTCELPNANANASTNARNGKFLISLRLRLYFTRVNRGTAKANER